MLSAIPSGIGNKFQQNGFLNSKFGSAYIESSCCRKIIRPLTFPGKLFITFKAVEAWGSKAIIKDSTVVTAQPSLSCVLFPLLAGFTKADNFLI